MRVPRYKPSMIGVNLQRRIVMALLVATLGMVSAFLSYPWVLRYYYLQQLEDPQISKRIGGLNVVSRTAVEDAGVRDELELAFVELYANDDDTVSEALVELGGWAVSNIPTFRQRFEDRLDTENDALFVGLAGALSKAGGWRSSERPVQQRCRWAQLRCQAQESEVRAAAIRECAEIGPEGEPFLEEVLMHNLVDESPEIRLAAVEAISICLPSSRVRLLQQVLNDSDSAVGQEAGARLELLRPQAARSREGNQPSVEQLLSKLQSSDYFAQLEAVDQIAKLKVSTPQAEEVLVRALQKVTRQGLAAGNGGLAGSGLTALAARGERTHQQLMLDVAATHQDQPMLRFLAARAAALLDPEAGGQALINLFATDSDVIRDLAAIEVAKLGNEVLISRLQSELFSSELEVRGPAAFALALMNRSDLAIPEVNMDFHELLIRRTTLLRENIHAETEWKPRGYYLCSRLILGDTDVREELEVFLLNDHFPRIAVFTAMLRVGETTPLDIILLSRAYSPQRRMALLRDMRFAEVLESYLPSAPRIEWASPPHMCRRQVDQLARWWSIYRWQLRFDEQRCMYELGNAGSAL